MSLEEENHRLRMGIANAWSAHVSGGNVGHILRDLMQQEVRRQAPKPGSSEATIAGCRCPVVENGGGVGFRKMAGRFVISGDCPVHAGDGLAVAAPTKSANAAVFDAQR